MRFRIPFFTGFISYSFTVLSIISSQELPPVLVVTDEVRRMEFSDQITLVGRTEAWVESRVVSQVSGRVQKINAKEGIWLESGRPLVSIDSDRIRFLLKAKQAETAQARLYSELAKTQLERTRELFGKNLVSRTALDSALAWQAIQEERYNELEAERDRLALDLENCVVAAPFSGYTGRKSVDVGEWVNPGMPVFEMVDLSKIRIKVNLPEKYFGHLSVGSQVAITISHDNSTLSTGIVTGLAPNASPETHTFPVIVEVPNSEGRFGGGMLVRATLSLDERFTSLAVSKDAIVRQGAQTSVYTVIEGKAVLIPVVTSSTNGEMVAVHSEELSAGTQVVVRGNERIFPGAPVNVGGNTPLDEKQESSEPAKGTTE